MFNIQWGDNRASITCVMLALAHLALPCTATSAEACNPPQHNTTRRMWLSVAVPDVKLDAMASARTQLRPNASNVQHAPTWQAVLVWNLDRLILARHTTLLCGEGGTP